MQMKMWCKLFFLCLLPAQPVAGIQIWDQNLHVALVQNISTILNKSHCWICTQIPTVDRENSWPLIGVLMNETSLSRGRRPTYHSNFLAAGRWSQVPETNLPIPLTGLTPEHYAVPCVVINATGKATLPPYCHDAQTKIRVPSTFVAKMVKTPWRMIPPKGEGWYWLCGDQAWKILPFDKDRACALGAVIPHITISDRVGGLGAQVKRVRRSVNPLVGSTTFHSMLRDLIPAVGVFEFEKAIVNISTVVESIKAIQKEIHSLSQVVLENRMALDFFQTSQGGVCKVIDTSCCSYIDQRGRVNMNLKEILEQTQIRHQVTLADKSWDFENILNALTSWLPNWTWLKWLFIPVPVAIGPTVPLKVTIAVHLYVLGLIRIAKTRQEIRDQFWQRNNV